MNEAPNLTLGERNALVLLAQAWNAYIDLPCKDSSEVQEFRTAINAAQHIIALRVARRVDPEFWTQPEPPDTAQTGSIVALCGMATATAKPAQGVYKPYGYISGKVGGSRGLRFAHPRVLVLEAEHPNVLSVFGETSDIEVFHEAWQTHLWPSWETHENPAARNLLRQSKYHWDKHGRGLFQLGSMTFMGATAKAIEACKSDGIHVVYQEGFTGVFCDFMISQGYRNTNHELKQLEATRTWLQAILT